MSDTTSIYFEAFTVSYTDDDTLIIRTDDEKTHESIESYLIDLNRIGILYLSEVAMWENPVDYLPDSLGMFVIDTDTQTQRKIVEGL